MGKWCRNRRSAYLDNTPACSRRSRPSFPFRVCREYTTNTPRHPPPLSLSCLGRRAHTRCRHAEIETAPPYRVSKRMRPKCLRQSPGHKARTEMSPRTERSPGRTSRTKSWHGLGLSRSYKIRRWTGPGASPSRESTACRQWRRQSRWSPACKTRNAVAL